MTLKEFGIALMAVSAVLLFLYFGHDPVLASYEVPTEPSQWLLWGGLLSGILGAGAWFAGNREREKSYKVVGKR
jgi:multisubunit Na+/H+ antiporter MnhB subunit